MSLEERIEKLEQQANNISEQETDIPKFQNPDTCVLCDDANYDYFIFVLLRVYYNIKNGTEYEELDKETCIHHKDKWLKHSHRTAGFIWSAITDHGKKSMTNEEIIEVFKNKEKREKLLTESYDRQKNFASWIDLYDLNHKRMEKGEPNRYMGLGCHDIEEDAKRNDKILYNKVKTYYTNAIEVLQAYDEETQ